MSEKLIDSFEISPDQAQWEMHEASSDEPSVVDGVNILGRAVGPFFAPDGESLNKRFYSKNLWENAISRNTERLKFGEMLGTIGHDQELSDQALLEGKVSHKVTKLWIDEKTKTGMGEIQILSTPAGKVLNSYLRGGVRLKVSSRALGEYKGKTSSGSNIIDEDTFNLMGFDFVQSPGVKTAIPVLVEHHEITDSDNVRPNPITENIMTDHLERVLSEKVKLEENLNSSIEKVVDLESQNRSLNKLVESKETINETLTKELNEAKAKNEALVADLENAKKANESYVKLGTPEEISSKVSTLEESLGKYSELGSPEKLTEALDKTSELVEDLKDIGTIAEISEVFDVARSYIELGPLVHVRESLEVLEKYMNIGSIDEINAKLDVIKTYEDLGTPEEISKAFNLTNETLESLRKKKVEESVSSFVEKFGVEKSIAESLIQKHGIDEATKIVENLKIKSDISDRYRKTPPANKTNENLNPKNESLNFNGKTDPKVNESYKEPLSTRLMSRFAK